MLTAKHTFMKKIMSFLLAFTLPFLSVAQSDETNPFAPSSQRIFYWNGTPGFAAATLQYKSTVQVATAIGLINAYVPPTQKTVVNFVFNANDVIGYIHETGATYVHFLLAKNGNTPCMIMTCVDAIGDDIYLKRNSQYLVLASTTDQNLAIQPRITATLDSAVTGPNNPLNLSLTNLIQSIPLAQANYMINAYRTNQVQNSTALSFVLSASDMYDFINKMTDAQQNPTMSSIDLHLGEDRGRLVLMFTGVNNMGNHMYYTDVHGRFYSLEHCYPCPTCNIYNYGNNIEPTTGLPLMMKTYKMNKFEKMHVQNN